MFLVKMFIPYIPFLPNRAATAVSADPWHVVAELTGMIAVEVLFQWLPLNCSESVGRESPRQDTDAEKSA